MSPKCSVQFSRSVVSDSLQPHGLQHARPPCPSLTPDRLMSIESVMPSNHLILCHPLLLLPSIFPATGSFPMSQLFTSGGQSIGVSTSASVLPMNFQGLISFRIYLIEILAVQGTLKSLQYHSLKASFLTAAQSSLCMLLTLLKEKKMKKLLLIP